MNKPHRYQYADPAAYNRAYQSWRWHNDPHHRKAKTRRDMNLYRKRTQEKTVFKSIGMEV